MAEATFGISLLIIIVIEASFLKKAYEWKWNKAILLTALINLISIVAGLTLTVLSSKITNFPKPGVDGSPILFLILLLLIQVSLSRYRAPLCFAAAVFITMVVGIIFGQRDYYSTAHSNVALLILMELPLLLAFSISLILKTYCLMLCKINNFWLPLLKGTACSFILMGFLMPFFALNPYQLSPPGVKHYIGYDVNKAIDLCHAHRVSVQHLLGITMNEGVPDNYDWSFEIELIETYNIYSKNSTRWDNAFYIKRGDILPVEFIDELIKSSRITKEAVNRMLLVRQHWTYINRAYNSVRSKDQSDLNNTYEEWIEWGNCQWGESKLNQSSDKSKSWANSPYWVENPCDLITTFLKDKKSQLANPCEISS